jgi:predicted DNA repair protein MutK
MKVITAICITFIITLSGYGQNLSLVSISDMGKVVDARSENSYYAGRGAFIKDGLNYHLVFWGPLKTPS